MPIHHWVTAPSGLFHHFHQAWSVEICNTLNAGLLPGDYYALIEQRAAGIVPDVLALVEGGKGAATDSGLGGSGSGEGAAASVVATQPKARFITRAELDPYAARANRVAVRSVGGELVAVIEVVSPGNKVGRAALRSFVEKAIDLLRHGVHLLIIDLLPPTPRDPQGLHKAICDEIQEEPFTLPPETPLTLAAYTAGVPITAYVEPVAVGEALPEMPLFLDSGRYVPLPLEKTYQDTWGHCPPAFKRAIAGPAG